MDWNDAALRIGLARVLRISDYLPVDFINHLTLAQEQKPDWWRSASTPMEQLRNLEIYGHVRALSLSITQSLHVNRLRRTMSLHNLLWSVVGSSTPAKGRSLATWSHPPSPDAPVLGLPSRIALAMLRDAIQHLLGEELTEESAVPPIWLLHKSARKGAILGRMAQLGIRSLTASDLHQPASVRQWISVSKNAEDWSVQPHSAFFLPEALGVMKSRGKAFDLWCHVLLFYTALEGSERFLDSLVSRGPGTTPFKERWDLRGRIPLHVEIWEALDKLLEICGFRRSGNDSDALILAEQLKKSLDRLTAEPSVSIHDFRWERVDVLLDLTKSLEVPQAILPFAHNPKVYQGRELFKINESALADCISVRIGQIKAAPDWKCLTSRFPALNRQEIQQIMSEAWATLFSEEIAKKEMRARPEIIIFPEVTIPRSEITAIQKAAAERSVAVFCGLLWRVLPTLARPHFSVEVKQKFFINEGLLTIPLRFGDDNGPPLVKSFVIEKPMPSAIEHGLAKFLSGSFKGVTNAEWRALPGRRWFRFLHPSWGDFSVAICSDLLDASPWVALRGEILHLFMCAYNPDVELYEALTWVRAYENYVNMVSVNHGQLGGSFAWSPQHGGKKEIAKLRGGNLFLTADVVIPVKELLAKQKIGLRESIDHQAETWFKISTSDDLRKARFKTPPLEFPSRNELD